MAVLNKIFTFDTGTESWVLTSPTSRVTTDGYPNPGCLETYLFGKSKTSTGLATWSGTYETLGVPVGATVNSVALKFNYGISVANYSAVIEWDIKSAIGYLIGTMTGSAYTPNWITVTGPTFSGLGLASSTAFNMSFRCKVTTGNNNISEGRFLADQIELIIDYTPIPVIPPSGFSTFEATDVTRNGAVLHGQLDNLGDSESILVYFQFKKYHDTVWTSTPQGTLIYEPGTFSRTVVIDDLFECDYDFRSCGNYDDNGVIRRVVSATTRVASFKGTDLVFIERSTGDNLNYELISIANYPDPNLITSFDDTADLVPGTTYYYRIKRHLNVVYSEYSNEVAVLYTGETSIPEGQSEAVVVIATEGTASKLATAYSEVPVTVALESYASKLANGGLEATILVVSEGSGEIASIMLSGGSETTILITSDAAGVKQARSPPSESSVLTSTEGAYDPIKSGYSDTSITVSQDGYSEKISNGSAEASTVTSVDGSGTSIRQGSSQTTIVVTSEGSGQPIFGNGSTANVSVVAEGVGSTVRTGYSESSVSIISEGSGQTVLGNGSMASVSIVTEGYGSATKLDGTESIVSVESHGAGSVVKLGSSSSSISVLSDGYGVAYKSNGSEAVVTLGTDGSGVGYHIEYHEGAGSVSVDVETTGDGTTSRKGYSQINVFVVDRATGFKLGSGESTRIVSVRSAGYGRRVANGYSEATSSNVSALGSGVHIANRVSEVGIVTDSEGSGFAVKNGGSHRFITSAATGQGVKSSSGASQEYVVLSTRGIACKVALGYSNASTLVSVSGEGERVIEVYSGNSEAPVNVDTETTVLRTSEGSSESVVNVHANGYWATDRTASSEVTVTVVPTGSGYNVPLPGVPVEILTISFDTVLIVPGDDSFVCSSEEYIFTKAKENDFIMPIDLTLCSRCH